MRPKSFLLLITCVATQALASEPTPASLERLLEVSGVERNVAANTERFAEGFAASIGELLQIASLDGEARKVAERYQAEAKQMIRERMAWSNLKPIFLRINRETYTEEEIQTLIAFYETPAGRKCIEKMQIVVQRVTTDVETVVNPLVEELQNRMLTVRPEVESLKLKKGEPGATDNPGDAQ